MLAVAVTEVGCPSSLSSSPLFQLSVLTYRPFSPRGTRPGPLSPQLKVLKLRLAQRITRIPCSHRKCHFYAILSMTSVPRCLLSLHCLFCPQFVQSIHFFTWLVLYNLFFNSSALYSALASALSVPSRQVPFACLVLRRRNCSPRPCKARDSASLYTINVVCFLITSALTRYRTDNWYFWYP